MLKKLLLSYEDFVLLKKYCDRKGIQFLSTPFDLDSIHFLEKLGCSFWKVPSGEITNYPYLLEIAGTGKPVIMSTGMASMKEVEEAVALLRHGGCSDLKLLHCTTEYPAPYKDVNLKAMLVLKERFGVEVGYSDHTPGIEIPVAAAALGACVIEKHFTLDKKLPGNDHYHAGEPEDFKKAIANFKWIDMVLGSGEKTVLECEWIPRREARRSLVLTRDMKADEVIRKEDLMPKRPGTGISPVYTDIVVGRKVVKDLEEELLEKINALDIGPQGFGGKTTALCVNIETYPTHIAGLPVAVNVGCHVTRHASKII